MKLQQIILILYLTASHAFAKNVPRCIDLIENTESFYIEYLQGNRTCAWAGRRDKSWRCSSYDEVPLNCPHTCGVECLSEPPSETPSTSLFPTSSPTTNPTQSPTLSPTDLVDCEKRVDNPEKFLVEGTMGNELRSCEWAGRKNEEQRCDLEIVRRNCQVTCNIPCHERAEPANFAQSNEQPVTKKDSFPYDVVFITIGSVAIVVIIALVFHKRKEWFPSNFDHRDRSEQADSDKKSDALEFDETDDAADDGYNVDWCGWGATPSTNPKMSETNKRSDSGIQHV
jgi:hypothetical protein